MDNPGIKNLGSSDLSAINAATTATVVTSAPDVTGATVQYIDGLEGMVGATISANFTWGSGAGTLKVMIDTTLNQGATWVEVGRMAFGAASEENVINLTNAQRTTPYTPVDLSDDSAVDGMLGTRFRARILKAGSAYAGTTALAIRLTAR